jgi:predicted amidohydrolase
MSKVGIVQMNSGANPEANIQQLQLELKLLHLQQTKLALTPENSIVFGTKEDYQNYAEPLGNGKLQNQLANLALEYQLWLIIGSFPIKNTDGSLSATCLVFNDNGKLVDYYHKLHIFDADVEDSYHSYRESDIFSAGNAIKVVKTIAGNIGLSICYDVRFPQLYQMLRQQGADIIVIPAAFTKVTGEAHWDILIRARAIETQCWVLAANQWGIHGVRETWGHSMIIDPWGTIVAIQQQGTGTIIAETNNKQLKSIRNKMPIAHHTRISSQLRNL